MSGLTGLIQIQTHQTDMKFSLWRLILCSLIPVSVSSLQRLQGRHEAGGPGPSKLHLHLHRHGDGLNGREAPPTTGRQRQHQRLLAIGRLRRHPANRNLREERRHAAAAAGYGGPQYC